MHAGGSGGRATHDDRCIGFQDLHTDCTSFGSRAQTSTHRPHQCPLLQSDLGGDLAPEASMDETAAKPLSRAASMGPNSAERTTPGAGASSFTVSPIPPLAAPVSVRGH